MSDKARCTICGEPMPNGEQMFKYHGYARIGRDEAYALMRNGRDLYKAEDGAWWLTQGGGRVSDGDAARLQQMPGIVPRYKYQGRHHRDCFGYGATIDLDETVRLRKECQIGKYDFVFVTGRP